ncbi:hypothetical protein N0V90_004654 [Kalmusia sp. IMI 367209]|nr:hypothetical protein N0V90_004654 [Kalmusia sp. IMI 367209]
MRALIIALFAIVAVAAARTGSSIVVNQGFDPIYLWVVPDVKGSPIGDRITLHAGGAWAEQLHAGRIGNSTSTIGVAIKVAKDENGLWDGAPLQILAYTLAGERVCLDAVNGAPFKGQNVRVSSEGAGSIEWPHGEDIGDVTRDNGADRDVVLVISAKE